MLRIAKVCLVRVRARRVETKNVNADGFNVFKRSRAAQGRHQEKKRQWKILRTWTI